MAPYRQNQCKVTENFWPGQMKDLPHGIPAKLILVKMVEPQSLTFFQKNIYNIIPGTNPILSLCRDNNYYLSGSRMREATVRRWCQIQFARSTKHLTKSCYKLLALLQQIQIYIIYSQISCIPFVQMVIYIPGAL